MSECQDFGFRQGDPRSKFVGNQGVDLRELQFQEGNPSRNGMRHLPT